MSNQVDFRTELEQQLRKTAEHEMGPAKDRQEWQSSLENDLKNTVNRLNELRFNRKKFEAQISQLKASIDKKRNILESVNEKLTLLQQDVSSMKSKIAEREALIYPVFEFYESMGLRFEIFESQENGFHFTVKILLSKIMPEPERIFTVDLLYSPVELKIIDADPKELIEEISNVAMDVNSKLVNEKIHFLLFLHGLRKSIIAYLTKS